MERLKNKEWNYHPKIPIENNPLFSFPFIIKRILKWYVDMWAPFSETVFCLIFAIIYLFLFPPIELFKNLDFKGVSIIYLYNITIMLVVAGGLHLFFYTFKKQENILKYDSRKVSNNKIFTFNKQIFDNIFWSLVSGVTIWTFYETLLF